MNTLQPYGQFQYYPPRIPDHDADVFAESGAARLLDPSGRPNAIAYNFQDQRFAVLDPYAGTLHRSASSSALNTQNGQVPLMQTLGYGLRPSTPQPYTRVRKASQITVTDEMRNQADELGSKVQKYNSGLDRGDIKLDFGQCRTIDDLNVQLEAMASRYKKADTTKNTALRHMRLWMRKSAFAAAGVNSWLQLLPGDSKELSFLVGGVKIVFGVSLPTFSKADRLTLGVFRPQYDWVR